MKTINVKYTVAFVDDEDFDKVNQYKWCLNNRGYATAAKRDGNHGVFSMHELVMGNAPEGLEWHHKNGDKLDNQKKNLEAVSRSHNQIAKGVQANNQTGMKGVCFDRTRGKYLANIEAHGRRVFLGRFNSAREAALAYNQAAVSLHGEHAFLNQV